MSASNHFRDRVFAILKDAGVCEGRVFRSRQTPTQDTELPAVMVFLHAEQLSAAGNHKTGIPKFNRVATVGVIARTADHDGATAMSDAGTIVQQALDLLLGDAALMAEMEGVPGIEIAYAPNSQGQRRVVDGQIGLRVEWHEDYPPLITDDLEKIVARDPAREHEDPEHEDAGRFGVDLIDPGDGPDGAIEAEFDIDLPTE